MMKRENKILLVLICVPLLLIFSYLGFYSVKKIIYTFNGKRELTTYIENTKIPKKNIMIIDEGIGGKMFTLFSYSRDITTKSDYENWKKEIKDSGKFLNGKSVPKNYKPQPKDCELQYSFTYDFQRKKVDFQYVLSGTYTADKKTIEQEFSYPNIPFYSPPE